MSKSITSDDDAQAANYPLRFEATVRWDRPLTHECDDPDRLKKRLGLIPVDGDVSVREFTDTSATVLVESAPEEMDHTPGLIEKTVRRVFRNYSKRVIGGDSLTDPPLPGSVKRKYVKRAYQGYDRNDLRGYVSPEDWEKAKEIAADLNLEGAPCLEPDITLRTIDGDYDA